MPTFESMEGSVRQEMCLLDQFTEGTGQNHLTAVTLTTEQGSVFIDALFPDTPRIPSKVLWFESPSLAALSHITGCSSTTWWQSSPRWVHIR